MKEYTFRVNITLPAPSSEEALRLLKGMLDSERILKISYTVEVGYQFRPELGGKP